MELKQLRSRCYRQLQDAIRRQDVQALPCLTPYLSRARLYLQFLFKGYIASEDLDDIIGNVQLKALDKGPDYDPKVASVGKWINMLAYYEALTFVRRHGNQVPIDEIMYRAVAEPYSSTVTSAKLRQEIEAILAHCDEKQAEIVRRYYLEGEPISKIASDFGVKEATVRSTLCRALQRIRKALGLAGKRPRNVVKGGASGEAPRPPDQRDEEDDELPDRNLPVV